MNSISKKTYSLVMLSLLTIMAYSQQIYNNQIEIPTKLYQEGNTVYLMYDIDITGLKIGSERTMLLTPVLSNQEKELIFPPVMINGKKRQKAYERGLALSDNVTPISSYEVLVAGKKNKSKLHYHESVPYEKWMDNATLYMVEELCGCGGHREEILRESLVSFIPPAPKPEPVAVEVVPIPTVIKPVAENREFSTMLEFPVSQHILLHEFENNKEKFIELENNLRSIVNNNNIQISRIDIHGYSSPEGTTAFNLQLSEARANELKAYLLERYPINEGLYHVYFSGEDWNKLIELLDESDLADKGKILSIINNTESVVLRKENLKKLNDGVPYRQMLKELYPQIRRVTLHVYYKEVK